MGSAGACSGEGTFLEKQQDPKLSRGDKKIWVTRYVWQAKALLFFLCGQH